MKILELLEKTEAAGVSDLLITAGKPAYHRRYGKVETCGDKPIKAEDVDEFRNEVLLDDARKYYDRHGNFDAGLTLDANRRFRINFFMEEGHPGLVARPVPAASNLDFSELNLPEAIRDFADSPRGLVLISGSAGSGKSTTMAAIVNHINVNYQKHIVTIEDPIEFIHQDHKSLVTQREVGADTSSFGEALRHVVRETPDVICIGEMRDLDTMQTAITAALTGHLVISTLHTTDTVQAIERIINHFPEHLRAQAADDLSLALRGVVAQRLVERDDQEGMIPVVEIMAITPYVRNLIAHRNFKELEEAIKRGHEEGMLTFTRAASELFREGRISLDTGKLAAGNRDEFLLLVQGMESGIETFRDDFTEGRDNEYHINMKQLLKSAVGNEASDLILTVGTRPTVRIDGELMPLDSPPLTPMDTKRLLFSIINPRQRAVFEEERELDFALSINIKRSKSKEKAAENYRFRVNGFYQRGNIGIAVRVIPRRIPTPDELGLPPALVNLADKKHGLILITGPTGHGKTTTLASLIDRINSKRACHIITIEDPIEYVHKNKKAVIEQREVYADTHSFSDALKYVLRQDPDVILVGEMRDAETIAAALTAAETGHLVMATLHTNSAPQSVDRIIDTFPGHQQGQIRMQLAGTLLGIVAQRLIPKRDGSGRIGAFEILIGSTGCASMIREGKTHHMKSMMETSSKEGMVTMEKALRELYSKNLISRDSMNSLMEISKRDTPFG